MKRFAMALAGLFAIGCSTDPTAPRPLPPHHPAFAFAAPTGIVVDSVVGMTVYASWTDNAADNSGFYLALSDAADVNATKRYQIVYGGDVTTGSITAYDGEAGCYLVSVFAWGFSDTDSQWSTTGPVAVGGGVCAAAGAQNGKRKGKR